ncbi:MAG: hypothetical protein PHE59_01970 [Patescibacteria group bacterium]|nr:hypothetical protein [Patescibacteria group bacterium]MDD5164112.1 hypothetical protein [Patescibacteria group bacterium]MDD5534230.1 hypothetical protein [Patescibacteria group bacterium]
MSLFNEKGLENLRLVRDVFLKTGLPGYDKKSKIIYSPKEHNPLTVLCQEVLSILSPEKTKAVQLGRWIEIGLLEKAKLSLKKIIEIVPIPLERENVVLVFPENIISFEKQIQLIGGKIILELEFLKNLTSSPSDKPYWLYKAKDGTDDFREISLDKMAKENFVLSENKRGLTPTEGLAMFIQDPSILKGLNTLILTNSICQGKFPRLLKNRLGQVVLSVSHGQGWGAPTCAK